MGMLFIYCCCFFATVSFALFVVAAACFDFVAIIRFFVFDSSKLH